VVGYNTFLAIAAIIGKAGSTDTEALIEAARGIEFDSPLGTLSFRAIDHQSTMGAYVGRTTVQDGKGVMVDFEYRDGADYLPSEEEARELRTQ
jgi:branched-chain amino acid transport system substrate-binding protein